MSMSRSFCGIKPRECKPAPECKPECKCEHECECKSDRRNKC